jgi:hypothetical protein
MTLAISVYWMCILKAAICVGSLGMVAQQKNQMRLFAYQIFTECLLYACESLWIYTKHSALCLAHSIYTQKMTGNIIIWPNGNSPCYLSPEKETALAL